MSKIILKLAGKQFVYVRNMAQNVRLSKLQHSDGTVYTALPFVNNYRSFFIFCSEFRNIMVITQKVSKYYGYNSSRVCFIYTTLSGTLRQGDAPSAPHLRGGDGASLCRSVLLSCPTIYNCNNNKSFIESKLAAIAELQWIFYKSLKLQVNLYKTVQII